MDLPPHLQEEAKSEPQRLQHSPVLGEPAGAARLPQRDLPHAIAPGPAPPLPTATPPTGPASASRPAPNKNPPKSSGSTRRCHCPLSSHQRRLRDGKATWKQGACSAPPLASTAGYGTAAPQQAGAGGGGDAKAELRWRGGWGGHLGRAALLPRGGLPPGGAAYAQHTRTYARTRHRPHARQRGAGPRPVSASGVIPRVRARPPAGARARFPGQSARRGEFHARSARPALTLAIAAEGRGRRARKRTVSGGCRDRVGFSAAGGVIANTEPGAGRAARRPWKARPERGGWIVCGVCSDSAEGAAPRLRSAPAVCRLPRPGPRHRFPAERQYRVPAGGAVAPDCVGKASWPTGFCDLGARRPLGSSHCTGDWPGLVLFSFLFAWRTSLPLPQLNRVSPSPGDLLASDFRRQGLYSLWKYEGGGQTDFVVSSFVKREAGRGGRDSHVWRRAEHCWCSATPGLCRDLATFPVII